MRYLWSRLDALGRGEEFASVRSIALAGLMASGLFVGADRLVRDVLGWKSVVAQVAEVGVMTLITCGLLWMMAIRPLLSQMRREQAAAEFRRIQIEANAKDQEFVGRLHRGLEMATTEEAAYRTTQKALSAFLPVHSLEVLLADSSEAHLRRVISVGQRESGSCSVVAPHDCPAVRGAATLTFTSSTNLDACPFLEGRSGGAVSATCVPVSVGGRSIGVVHAVADPGESASPAELRKLEAIASQAGSRIGMLRVMAATTLQAATDPLTGLLNRRSLENRVHELGRRQTPYALAMGDLDHFKHLNDTYGHDAGDRALRLFAQTLTRTLRDEDLICRYGGEEFVVVFPGRTTEEAAQALARLQESLLLALAGGTTPPFTVSFGVAHSGDCASFEDLIRAADAALFQAKRDGRDRVVVEKAARVAAIAEDRQGDSTKPGALSGPGSQGGLTAVVSGNGVRPPGSALIHGG